MSNSDRRRYESATVLDQKLLDDCQDNLEIQLELTVDIETPTGFIRASDRPKYVGDIYYDNRLRFPIISRTVGEWLSTEIELSTLKLSLNNADGEYDEFLPGNAGYGGFIGKSVEVKLGLRDVAATYTTIFKGTVSSVSGFARDIKSIEITARDDYERLQADVPGTVLSASGFPDIDPDVAGLGAPIVYGDWTLEGNPAAGQASVPAFVVNGQLARAAVANRVELYVSQNDLQFLDTSGVYLFRGSDYWQIDSADVDTAFYGNVRQFRIIQDSGNTQVGDTPENFVLKDGDTFFVKCRGKDLGTYDDNIVEQAKDILITYAGLTAGDFDANWATFRDKASPAQDAISTVKSRVHIQESQTVLQYVLSMLEQVRLEMFIDRDLKIKLNSLHFSDFEASPSYRLTNFDVEREQLRPRIDERNNFNLAQGFFNFLPDLGEQAYKTSIYKNQAAITQQNLEIAKKITFPNLYIHSDAVNNLQEILKLASAGFENVYVTVTWRSLLLDIGDFLSLDVKIGSTVYDSVPCLVREIGYDADGIKIPLRLWSFQLAPFGAYAGAPNSVGGESAVITEVT